MNTKVMINDAVFDLLGEQDITCDECGAICDPDKLKGWCWESDGLAGGDKQRLLCPGCAG